MLSPTLALSARKALSEQKRQALSGVKLEEAETVTRAKPSYALSA